MKKVLEILREVREEVLANKGNCTSKSDCYSLLRRNLEEGILKYYSKEEYYFSELRRDDRYTYKTYEVKRKGESGALRITLNVSTKKEGKYYFIADIVFTNENSVDVFLDKHIDEEVTSNNHSIISSYNKIDEELLAGFKKMAVTIMKCIKNKEEISFNHSYNVENIMKQYNERIRKYNDIKKQEKKYS